MPTKEHVKNVKKAKQSLVKAILANGEVQFDISSSEVVHDGKKYKQLCGGMYANASTNEQTAFVIYKYKSSIIIVYVTKGSTSERKKIACTYTKNLKGFYIYEGGGACEYKAVKATKSSVSFFVREPVVVPTDTTFMSNITKREASKVKKTSPAKASPKPLSPKPSPSKYDVDKIYAYGNGRYHNLYEKYTDFKHLNTIKFKDTKKQKAVELLRTMERVYSGVLNADLPSWHYLVEERKVNKDFKPPPDAPEIVKKFFGNIKHEHDDYENAHQQGYYDYQEDFAIDPEVTEKVYDNVLLYVDSVLSSP